ncbi:MAG: leucine-rich repeat protein [Eubacteriales bacterium]|nr:leucine-rich repeat protein [Eubacteriales bacterium]
MKSYTGDITSSFSMMGKSYYYGVAPSGYTGSRQILYNLDGQFSSVTLEIGAIDTTADNNPAIVYVYKDEQLAETWELTTEMITTSKTISTTGVTQLRFDIIRSVSGYGNIWYGLGNVIGYGGHLYKTEQTKNPTASSTGLYTHTCEVCGYSYTETIPAQTSCTPYLTPYSYDGQTAYSQVGGVNDYFTVMGKNYYQGVFARNYTSSKTSLYALNQQYKSITFKVGHMDGHDSDTATLYAYADGSSTPMKTVSLSPVMLNKEVTLSTEGVTQLKILIQADSTYGNVWYALFDMSYVPVSQKSHSYESEVTVAAGYGTTGIRTYTCKDCGLTYTETIPALKYNLSGAAVTLSSTSYTYNGKARKPSVTVTYNGVKLTKGTDYTVTYKNNTNIGKATVTVTGKGNYTGTKKATFTIKVDTKKTYTVGDLKYKITSTSKKTVQVTGVASTSKTTLTVPATVKIYGTTYKVTAIANKAFQKNTKLKSVTIGTNVQTIGSNAFLSCSKLTKITVKTTKLKSVGANALKGTKKNIQIVVPKKYTTSYKKLFTNKGQTIKIVKK